MSKIFISHSSANNASALAVGEWLKEAGWTEFFLDITPSRGLLPGERWQEALKAAADRCQVVLFLISPAWQASKFCFAEFFQAKNLGKRIFGVIVEPVELSTLPEQMTAEWQVCDLTTEEKIRIRMFSRKERKGRKVPIRTYRGDGLVALPS